VDQELVDKATMAAQVLEALTVVAEVVVVQVTLPAGPAAHLVCLGQTSQPAQ
jgi:hypothetical protein